VQDENLPQDDCIAVAMQADAPASPAGRVPGGDEAILHDPPDLEKSA